MLYSLEPLLQGSKVKTRSGRWVGITLRDNQDWLLNRAHKCQVDANMEGECHGIAWKATQAVLSHQLDQFDNDVTLIHNIPLTRFKTRPIERKYGASTWYEINTFFTQMHTYQELFTANKILKFLDHVSLIKQFTGAYTQEELCFYFQELELLLRQEKNLYKKPFSLILSNTVHSICVSYDALLNQWRLIDANELPTKRFAQIPHLARRIKKALFSKKDAIFTTYFFCNQYDEDVYTKIIQSWTSQASWQKMHAYSPEKMTILDEKNSNLLFVAAMHGDLDLLQTCINHHVNINEISDGDTPLTLATDLGHVLFVKTLLENGADQTLRNYMNKTSMDIATENKSNEIIDLLNQFARRGMKRSREDDTSYDGEPLSKYVRLMC